MFYVYHGYVDADNYDCSEGPVYKVNAYTSEADVLAFRMEFYEEINEDCSRVIFRVFEGNEREIIPDQKVVSYRFL